MKRTRLITLILCLAMFLMPCARAQAPHLYYMPYAITPENVLAVDVEANIQTIYAFITQEMGLTRAAACGILSNIRSESSFNPEAIGDSGAAYGICQWNSRRQSMINYCLDNGFESWTSLEGQLGYMRYELENNKKSVGDYLKTIPDTAQGTFDAAYHFCVYYEIPSDRFSKGVTRGKYAVNTYWIKFGGTLESYDVVYNANGGFSAPAAQVKTEGVPLTLTSAAPRRQGYELAGWARSPSAHTPEYAAGASYTENADITLYAVWQRALTGDTEPAKTVTLGNRLYEYYEGEFTWQYAHEFAVSRGGTLASARSALEEETISSILMDTVGACYLGGMLEDGNWIWSTGEAFDDAFADNYWAAGEPALKYGVSDKNRLARAQSGKWVALAGVTGEATGFVVEYGDNDDMDFDTYRVVVSSTLNLRSGPGTSYGKLGAMTPGTLITIYESVNTSGGAWGWGVTRDGARGWCSMKTDYIVKISGVDSLTQLAYQIETNGEATIVEYVGGASELTIPRVIAGCSVTRIVSGAFTKSAGLKLYVGDWVVNISSGAFNSSMHIVGGAGTAAHRAAVSAGARYEMILPFDRWILPASISLIDDEAFMGVDARVLDLSGSALEIIGARAFADCANLKVVLMPADIDYIAPDAFPPRADIAFIVVKGSYAETWAKANGYNPVAYSAN